MTNRDNFEEEHPFDITKPKIKHDCKDESKAENQHQICVAALEEFQRATTEEFDKFIYYVKVCQCHDRFFHSILRINQISEFVAF